MARRQGADGDGSCPGRAVGIQPGFIPEPDPGWKPMLHCSPE
jgi:hypothetical protein